MVILRFPAYRPDRWDNLPDAVKSQPGQYSNTLTFSAGPRVSSVGRSLLHTCLIYSPLGLHWDEIFDQREQGSPLYAGY